MTQITPRTQISHQNTGATRTRRQSTTNKRPRPQPRRKPRTTQTTRQHRIKNRQTLTPKPPNHHLTNPVPNPRTQRRHRRHPHITKQPRIGHRHPPTTGRQPPKLRPNTRRTQTTIHHHTPQHPNRRRRHPNRRQLKRITQINHHPPRTTHLHKSIPQTINHRKPLTRNPTRHRNRHTQGQTRDSGFFIVHRHRHLHLIRHPVKPPTRGRQRQHLVNRRRRLDTTRNVLTAGHPIQHPIRRAGLKIDHRPRPHRNLSRRAVQHKITVERCQMRPTIRTRRRRHRIRQRIRIRVRSRDRPGHNPRHTALHFHTIIQPQPFTRRYSQPITKTPHTHHYSQENDNFGKITPKSIHPNIITH